MANLVEKFAFLTYLSRSVASNGRLGKKALQKLVHLSAEIKNVPIGYKFNLYTYGPFSRELAGDVDVLGTLGALDISYDSFRNAYEIGPGVNSSSYVDRASDFIEKYKVEICFIVEKFGNRFAKDLELSSMLVFIIKNKLVDDLNDENIISKFLEIKPHYAYEEVKRGLREIRELI